MVIIASSLPGAQAWSVSLGHCLPPCGPCDCWGSLDVQILSKASLAQLLFRSTAWPPFVNQKCQGERGAEGKKGWVGREGDDKTTWSHSGSKSTEKLHHEPGRTGIYSVKLLGTIITKVYASLEMSRFVLHFFLTRETQKQWWCWKWQFGSGKQAPTILIRQFDKIPKELLQALQTAQDRVADSQEDTLGFSQAMTALEGKIQRLRHKGGEWDAYIPNPPSSHANSWRSTHKATPEELLLRHRNEEKDPTGTAGKPQ